MLISLPPRAPATPRDSASSHSSLTTLSFFSDRFPCFESTCCAATRVPGAGEIQYVGMRGKERAIFSSSSGS